jgi:hypothetical protein
MVVLRPGNDDFDSSLITFSSLVKTDNGYCSEILYDNEPLYYQFNDCVIEEGSKNGACIIKHASKDYEFIEQSIRERLVDESHNMFKRGFTEDILVKMQSANFWLDKEYLDVPAYTKSGRRDVLRNGEGDVIFQCCCVIFEQSSWELVWRLIQIRQEESYEVDSNYLFVDDPEEEEEEEDEDRQLCDTDNGYESDNEHTEDNFMFVPKPDNE